MEANSVVDIIDDAIFFRSLFFFFAWVVIVEAGTDIKEEAIIFISFFFFFAGVVN